MSDSWWEDTGRMRHFCLLLVLSVGLISLAGCISVKDTHHISPRSIVSPVDCTLTDSLFEFHSSFWLNLHNFLYKEAKRLSGVRDESKGAQSLFDLQLSRTRSLSSAENTVWQEVLDYYVDTVVKRKLGDSLVTRINNRLARVPEEENLESVEIDTVLMKNLHRAAPIYRSVWWPSHDSLNKQWIADMERQVSRAGGCLTKEFARIFGVTWRDRPIRVDASVYASWFGAYATRNPNHITLSTTVVGNQDVVGLESLFHEAGHLLMDRLDASLEVETIRQDRRLPRELSHLILFYTAGYLVTQVYPDHEPYASRFGIWDRNETARGYLADIEANWQPYLEGRYVFEEAVRGPISEMQPLVTSSY